jgi:hypothetical protein
MTRIAKLARRLHIQRAGGEGPPGDTERTDSMEAIIIMACAGLAYKVGLPFVKAVARLMGYSL